jgi:hypothetical protein
MNYTVCARDQEAREKPSQHRTEDRRGEHHDRAALRGVIAERTLTADTQRVVG